MGHHVSKGGITVARTSIADILALVGGPGLDDSTTDARQRFRAFLCQPKWSPEDLRAWIEECLELASRVRSEYYFVLQDIVTSIGTHLGFEVEFGSYTGTGADIPYDGKWRAITGETILLEVKSSPWPLGSVSQLGQYMDEHGLANGEDSQNVFGIYAIGYGDFSALIDQIKGSEYRNRIKVISFGDLLRLFSLRETLEQQMPSERVLQVIQDLLLPFESVNVGSILEIIQGVATAALPEGEAAQPMLSEGTDRNWRRSELHEFLDGCQPNQIAMFLALCSAPECQLAGEDVVSRMRALAPVVPGLDEHQAFTAKTIGGARSGLSKREQQIGRDSVIESANGRYGIREQYREWVIEWLRGRGLFPITVDVERKLGGLFQEEPNVGAAG